MGSRRLAKDRSEARGSGDRDRDARGPIPGGGRGRRKQREESSSSDSRSRSNQRSESEERQADDHIRNLCQVELDARIAACKRELEDVVAAIGFDDDEADDEGRTWSGVSSAR